jgi:hypothetical protein
LRSAVQFVTRTSGVETLSGYVANTKRWPSGVTSQGVPSGENSAGFPLEALPRLGIVRKMSGQDLDRNGAVEAHVARAVNLAHTSSAPRRLDLIRTEFRARG